MQNKNNTHYAKDLIDKNKIVFQVGLATLLPTTLVWGEAYVLMSSHVVAIVCWGLALAELMVPYSMKLLSLDMQSWLGLAMVGATTLSAGLFTCVFLLARRHGSRFSRPQASGYELACQDDLNQVYSLLMLFLKKKLLCT